MLLRDGRFRHGQAHFQSILVDGWEAADVQYLAALLLCISAVFRSLNHEVVLVVAVHKASLLGSEYNFLVHFVHFAPIWSFWCVQVSCN